MTPFPDKVDAHIPNNVKTISYMIAFFCALDVIKTFPVETVRPLQ
jgi:hypothetical protein